MALLWMDSVDHYDTAAIGEKWSSITTGTHTVTVAAEGRTANCLKWSMSGTANPCDVLSYAPVSIGTSASGVVGFAVRATNIANLEDSYSARVLFSVLGAHGGGHWFASVNLDGTLGIWRNSALPTLLGATGQALREDEWTYVEFEWTLHHTTGTIDVYINGILTPASFTYTGNTCADGPLGNSLSTQWTGFTVMGGYVPGLDTPNNMRNRDGESVTMRVDDVYVLDKSGGVNDSAWGGVSLGYIKPDAVGNSTQWDRAGVDSGNNWDQVDDATPDEGTDRIETDVVDEVDTYPHEDLAATVVVKALHIVASAKKGDDGTNTVAAVVRSNGVDYEQVERGVVSNTTYNYLCWPVDLDPDGDQAWTPTSVNAAEFGPKKTV